MEKCKYCGYITDNKIKFAKHCLYTHKLNRSNYILQTQYSGITPTCICGCGTAMKYNPVLGKFPSYIKKHLHIIQKGKTQEEIFGDMNSPKRIKAISDARKERFASGEYDHIKSSILIARKDPELGLKISKGTKGIPKPKPEGFGVGRKHSDETKEKMSKTAINKWETGDIGKRSYNQSKLETLFEILLDNLDLIYIRSYYAKEIKAFYDFYLPKFNIIIEVDGDFWHSNPMKYKDGPISKCQIKNYDRDKVKNQWAKDNGYKMLRFWEYDINNNRQQVIQTLLDHLK